MYRRRVLPAFWAMTVAPSLRWPLPARPWPIRPRWHGLVSKREVAVRRLLVRLTALAAPLAALLIGRSASAAPNTWAPLHPLEVHVAEYVLVGPWRSWPWPEPYRLSRAATLRGVRAEAFVAALDRLKTNPYKTPDYGCPSSPSPIYRIMVVYSPWDRVALATDGCIAIGQMTLFGKLVNEHRVDGDVRSLLAGQGAV